MPLALGPHPVAFAGVSEPGRLAEVCPASVPCPMPLAPATSSCRFLLELERRMEENVVISDVCDIVHHYAANDFSVYITYVSNQTYQERTYKQLL